MGKTVVNGPGGIGNVLIVIKTGHFARDCKAPCSSCHKPGHISRNCKTKGKGRREDKGTYRKIERATETARARAERKFQARHRDTGDVMVKRSDRCGIY